MQSLRWRLFTHVLGLALLLALLSAACSRDEPHPRVFVLGLDGVDPRVVDLLVSEGKLPNFARLRREGAYGRLLSQRPLLSPILWTTIATGKTADQHGIGHFVAEDPATGEKLPVTSRLRRVKALWNIASEADRSVAVVGWWATWPPEEVRGAVVSDHTGYHFLFEDGFQRDASVAHTWPPELAQRIEPQLQRPDDLTYEDVAAFADVSREEFAQEFDFEDELPHLKWALATARSYRDIGLDLWRRDQPHLALVYLEATDSTAHLFGHLFRAQNLAGELAEQQRRYGETVEKVYLFADEVVGQVLDAIAEAEATLVVLSDHGFDLGALPDDPSKTRDLRRVSERYHNVEGILYLWGRGVEAGSVLQAPKLVDVAPTVLSLLGLPAAEDMPGRVLEEGLEESAKTNLPARVATFETGSPAGKGAAATPRDPQTDQALLEHLRSLGYVGADPSQATSTTGDRNLAAIHFEAGRFREAAKIYARLIEEEPENASLRTSLAGTLGALERYEEAEAELRRALELEPLNPEAYHNLAVLAERQERPEEAIELYRTVLRYTPDYEPSRQALLRLTGRVDSPQAPRDDAETKAAELAQQASEAARRGDYPAALALLDQAQEQAPKYALLYQYRANVAYLMGDTEAAVQALRKGLELEPDNVLFQENLRRLGAQAP